MDRNSLFIPDQIEKVHMNRERSMQEYDGFFTWKIMNLLLPFVEVLQRDIH